MRPFVIGFSILVLTIASAQAQECSRVGAETCMNGAIYQCMQTGGVKGWILRAPYEKCQVQQKSCAEMAREFEAQVAVFNRKCTGVGSVSQATLYRQCADEKQALASEQARICARCPGCK
jgi:hypothetical protein